MLCGALFRPTADDVKRGKLVFTKYGDQYFLHEILCSACGMNVALPSSKHEKLARARQRGWSLEPDRRVPGAEVEILDPYSAWRRQCPAPAGRARISIQAK